MCGEGAAIVYGVLLSVHSASLQCTRKPDPVEGRVSPLEDNARGLSVSFLFRCLLRTVLLCVA